VKVFLNEEISPARIRSLRPDAVILATGARPLKLTVPGLAADRSMTAWDVMSGKAVPGGPCLVVGAGLVGCETADFLSEAEEKVTIIELLPEIAGDADKDTKAYFDIRFREKGVVVHTGVTLVGMEDRQAIIRRGDEELRAEAGTVIFSVGAKPEAALGEELAAAGVEVIMAGDCVKPRRILDSVAEGFLAGSRV
jgi:pyruvate/2-oxoglutarate dehydrogenase complex dihydrolipoamide dehydrogenase (E3) component